MVLLLITVMAFITVLTTIFVLLRIGGDHNEGFIVQYRPTLGLSAFQKGSSLGLISFAVFSLFICVFHTVLSVKVYHIRRYLALTILAMGVLLTILALVISNSLLLLS